MIGKKSLVEVLSEGDDEVDRKLFAMWCDVNSERRKTEIRSLPAMRSDKEQVEPGKDREKGNVGLKRDGISSVAISRAAQINFNSHITKMNREGLKLYRNRLKALRATLK